jgi:amino acid adenylation domain-containing protein
LWEHVGYVVQTLHAMGLARHDRVALVLPHGPEMATAVLGVVAGATCVPLNPAYNTNELDFCLTHLNVKALIVPAGMDSLAHASAHARGVRVIALSPRLDAEAGLFTLTGEEPLRAVPHEFAQPDDIALVMPTSGTTSRPKMVPLTHTNICTAAHHVRAALALVEHDRCVNVLPLFHLHGLVGMMLSSLAAGASIVCPAGFSASQFFAWMAEFHPTWYTAVPTIHHAILARAALHREIIARCPLRFIRSASAALPPPLRAELERVFKTPVIESYGMTETASQITSNPLPPRPRKVGSVGIAAGPEVAIMDERGRLLAAEETGEVVVRGASVFQGYDDDPLTTRNAFIGAWFRTGDQGFLDTDDYLFLTGRLKESINRGGEKIAPQEVDAVLMGHPAVAEAATFAVPDVRLGEELAAAVVLRPNATATAPEIRQFAATRLADFKVPRQVLIVEDIPKSALGKVQRLGLAEKLGLTTLEPAQPRQHTDFVAPRTAIEARLAGLWAQVLDLERVGLHDDFFQLGGDSLLAVQLLSRIGEAMHAEVSWATLFATPTVAGMAGCIATASRAEPDLQVPSLRPVPRDDALPLSYAQQRLWFLEQVGLSGQAYTLLEAMRLSGPLQVATLAQSLREITRRHEILRTTFINVEGQPRQVIRPATPVALPVVELPAGSERAREVQVRTLARAQAKQPFDLAQGPLVRATLVRLEAEEHVLLVTMHHIVSDGWSYGVFWRELALLYTAFAMGKPSPLPALPIQYADFAVWQRQWFQGDRLEPHLAYWKKRLAGHAALLELPTDYPRPPVQASRGAWQSLLLPTRLTEALQALSRQAGVTLFMTLLAAFKVFLYRHTGQEDILVGSPITDRSRVETEGLIGCFINTLVLRTDLSGAPTFPELLGRVRAVCLEAYAHQELPFEQLVEALGTARQRGHAPLVQVMFTFQNASGLPLEFLGLRARPMPVEHDTAKFDLTLAMCEEAGSLRAAFLYNADLCADLTITRMLERLQTLLAGIVADAKQAITTLPLLPAAERQQVLMTWSATQAASPREVCLQELFEAQVERTPDAVAVVCIDQQLTYRELNRQANKLAHFLRTLGVGPDVLVGICLERSLEMVIGLLGILKAGGAYVPLDPAYPQERLAFMLEDSQAPVLLTQQRVVARLPEHCTQVVCLDTDWAIMPQASEGNPHRLITADNLAYVIYTSGSTGQPKGVMIEHGAVCHFLLQMQTICPLTMTDRVLQRAPCSFDASVWEFFAPLVVGAQLRMLPPERHQDSAQLIQLMAAQHITVLQLVPSMLRVLLEAEGLATCGSMRGVICAGEELSVELQARFFAQLDADLHNFYGPTEATINATHWACERASHRRKIPIGRPMPNTQTYLLDAQLQPVPIGVAGDLYIGGAGLARGYLNRPELTAEKFIPNPYSDVPGARLYMTGDLARYLPDGSLEFLGRRDLQVKLRGVRIELGEIEVALAQHAAVREAVVVAREDTPGEQRLVAYIVLAQEPGPTVRELYHFLAQKLPDYMVPSTFVRLAALPLTPSGKVARQGLPSPDCSRPDLDDPFIAPGTSLEQQIAAIWCYLLRLAQIGVHDNFFELGGHSLLAMQLLYRVREATRIDVSLLSFFETPTVAGLARIIETATQTEPSVQVTPILPVPRQGPLPASITQEQLWRLAQVLPDAPFFHMPYAVRLTGPLSVTVLVQSLNEIIRRHEALRTTFAPVAGQLMQVIAPTLNLTLEMVDLCALPTGERESAAWQWAREEGQRPFDLAQGPLLRSSLLRLDEQEHILLLTMHHIISDGWTLGVLRHELTVLYDAYSVGALSPLPVLPIQYADFAYWQRQWQHSAAMQAQLAYWKQQLRHPLPVLQLPTDRPRTGEPLSFLRTARQAVVLPRALSEALKSLGHREGSTLFMTLLAAFKILLYGYTGQEDLCVGSLIANRHRLETEGLIGLFVNTVILRTDLRGNPRGREVLQRVRATALAAYAHQDLPFEELVRTLEYERELKRASLCQVLFVLQDTMRPPPPSCARSLDFLEIDQSLVALDSMATTFEVVLILRDAPHGLTGSCVYQTHLFDAATIQRMLADFQQVLEHLIARPEQPLSAFRAWGEAHGWHKGS